MDKPQKPINLLPESFGGQKENFSEDKIATGYQSDVPDILGGANLNYILDAAGKNFKYNNVITDFINGLPINNVITVNENNKLIYKKITDFLVANSDLSNLSSAGEKHFLNKTQITNCILEAPNGVATYTGNKITIKLGLKVLICNGRNSDKTLKNIEYTVKKDIDYITNNELNESRYLFIDSSGKIPSVSTKDLYISTSQPTVSNTRTTLWYNPDTNLYKLRNANSNDFNTVFYCIIGTYDWDGSSVKSLTPYQPVELVKKTDLNNVIYKIGRPIIDLDNELLDNEIWLEGATVSRTTYAELFKVYGTAYGAGDGSTTFVLPDFRNRTIWGANSFGYIEAGLPNITGKVSSICSWGDDQNGSLKITNNSGIALQGGKGTATARDLFFDASLTNSIYGKSITNQPASIKVRVKTRYK